MSGQKILLFKQEQDEKIKRHIQMQIYILVAQKIVLQQSHGDESGQLTPLVPQMDGMICKGQTTAGTVPAT